jgi:hypothetical protein
MPQPVLDDRNCRGQPNIKAGVLPACGSNTPPAEYPAWTFQYNSFHTPLYYAVTGVVAAGIDAVVPGFQFTVIMRWLSAVWLAAGMMCLYLVLRYWRAPVLVSAAAGLALATVPWMIFAGRTATNDAPAAVCGAAALYVLGRVLIYHRYGWILPATIAAAATATKVMNAAGLIAVAIVMGVAGIVGWIRRGKPHGWPLVKVALAVAISIVAVYLVWDAIQHFRAVPGYRTLRPPATKSMFTGFPLAEWFKVEFNGFSLTRGYIFVPNVDGPYLTGWAGAWNIVFTAVPIAAILLFARGSAHRLAGVALLVGCLAWPLAIQIQRYLGSNGMEYWQSYTSRYGMSLIPMAIGIAALMVARRRDLSRLWFAFTSVGLVIAFGTTMGVLGV